MKQRMVLAAAILTLIVGPYATGAELDPPAKGRIKVAFVITQGATMIDFAGPWEVFQDVHVDDRGESRDEMMPFELYTAGASR